MTQCGWGGPIAQRRDRSLQSLPINSPSLTFMTLLLAHLEGHLIQVTVRFEGAKVLNTPRGQHQCFLSCKLAVRARELVLGKRSQRCVSARGRRVSVEGWLEAKVCT